MQILFVTCHTCHTQARGDTCTNSVVTCLVSDKWHVSHIPNQFQFTLRRNIFLFPAALLAGVCRPHAGPGSVCRIVISSQHFAADFSTGVWSLEIWLQSVWAECDVWSLASHRISQSEGLSVLTWLTNARPFHGRTILANDLSILDRGHLAQPTHETWLLNIHRTLDWNSLHSCDKMIETWH